MKFWLISFLLLFSGCVFKGAHQYRLESTVFVENLKQKDAILRLKVLKRSDSLNERAIVYIDGAKMSRLSQSVWSDKLSEMVYADIYQSLVASALYRGVVDGYSRVYDDLSLDMRLFECAFFKEPRGVVAKVVLKADLYNSRTLKLLATKRFEQKRQVKQMNTDASIEAMQEALKAVTIKLIEWLDRV